MKRTWKTPLLLTHCDGCKRRRVCHPMPFYSWLCRQCAMRVSAKSLRALVHFAEQGR